MTATDFTLMKYYQDWRVDYCSIDCLIAVATWFYDLQDGSALVNNYVPLNISQANERLTNSQLLAKIRIQSFSWKTELHKYNAKTTQLLN